MSNYIPHTNQFIKTFTLCNLAETLFDYLDVVSYPGYLVLVIVHCKLMLLLPTGA